MDIAALRLLVEQSKGLLNRHWDAFESQDRKIAGLFTVATSLVAIVPTIVAAFDNDGVGWRFIPFGVGLSAYLLGLPLHWLAYNPSDVRFIGNARAYEQGWLELSEEEALRWTLLDMARQQEINDNLLGRKERWLRYASIAVGVEVSTLVVGVLIVMA